VTAPASRPAALAPFHGSYAPGDVTFLLHPIALQPIDDVRAKERLIQSGQRHYSEMLSPEALPSQTYSQRVHDAIDQGAPRMAAGLIHLARRILMQRSAPLVLVSLARAGTPVGVLMRRVLQAFFGIDAPHYSISIVRGRGVDACALDHIVARHAARSLVFIDGWSAKGSIAAELRSSLEAYAASRGVCIPAELFVLSDLSGQAQACATHSDDLLPHALLNATISGLVSRSVRDPQAPSGQFHGCVFYADWHAHDYSNRFVDQVFAHCLQGYLAWAHEPLPALSPQAAQQRMLALLQQLAQQRSADNPHLIKPGIGEATRALMRRAPRLLIVRDADSAAVQHLLYLAHERAVPVDVDSTLSFGAVVIIESMHDV
jgi:ribosomal protein L7Ae-like RNA K-turn-binding protein